MHRATQSHTKSSGFKKIKCISAEQCTMSMGKVASTSRQQQDCKHRMIIRTLSLQAVNLQALQQPLLLLNARSARNIFTCGIDVGGHPEQRVGPPGKVAGVLHKSKAGSASTAPMKNKM